MLELTILMTPCHSNQRSLPASTSALCRGDLIGTNWSYVWHVASSVVKARVNRVTEKQFRLVVSYFFYFDPAALRNGYFSIALGVAGQGTPHLLSASPLSVLAYRFISVPYS